MKYILESVEFDIYQNEFLMKKITEWLSSIWRKIGSYSDELIFEFFIEVTNKFGLDIAKIIYLNYDLDELKYWSTNRPEYENGVNTKRFIKQFVIIRPQIEQMLGTE